MRGIPTPSLTRPAPPIAADHAAFPGPATGERHAHDHEEVRRRVAAVAEVRDELVERIRERIRNGTYRIDPDAIADRIVDRLLGAGD